MQVLTTLSLSLLSPWPNKLKGKQIVTKGSSLETSEGSTSNITRTAPLTNASNSSGLISVSEDPPVRRPYIMTHFPFLPQLAQDRLNVDSGSRIPDTFSERPAKRSKVTFSGAAMDSLDAQWYDNDDCIVNSTATTTSNQIDSTPDNATGLPLGVECSVNVSTSSRSLVRLDSEQAVEAYLNDIT